jgi:hypothetical protein
MRMRPRQSSSVRQSPEIASTRVTSRSFSTAFLPEPELRFGNDGTDTDPKRGLTLYGPCDLGTVGHRDRVRVGIVGTDTTIEQAIGWLEECAMPIEGVSGKLRQMPHFPGFHPDAAFHSLFVTQNRWQQRLAGPELGAIFESPDRRTCFEQAVARFARKVQLIAELDDKPDVILCALPQEIVDVCRSIGPKDTRAGSSRAMTPLERLLEKAAKSGQMTFLEQLFGLGASDQAQLVYRTFRRALSPGCSRAGQRLRTKPRGPGTFVWGCTSKPKGHRGSWQRWNREHVLWG